MQNLQYICDMGNKHTQMPHELGFQNKMIKLKPVDKLVYVYLRSFANKEGETFVSIDTLSSKCELSWKTVSDSITRLLQAQEITLVAKDIGCRSRTYKITKDDRHFEMFSQEFLDHLEKQDYTISEKCVLICLHEYSYKTQNYGELQDTLNIMAEKINMPIRTFKSAMQSLRKKGVIEDKYNHDNKLVRRVQWDKIMMQTIYQVQENTEDIKQLKAQNSEQEERIAQLEAQLKLLQSQVKPIETFDGFEF